MEFTPVKFLLLRDVLGRLTPQPLIEIAAVVNPCKSCKLVAAVRIQVRAVASQRMREQHFGGQSRRRDAALLENFGALPERGLKSQHRTPLACDSRSYAA